MRKILLTGGTGQLGIALLRSSWPLGFEVHAPSRTSLDLTDAGSVRSAIDGQPWACVINAAAYTAVDEAESDTAAAFLANCQGPEWLAEATARAGIPLIHVSTDYVFSGDAGRPYAEDDPTEPANAYGASKAKGEIAVLAAHPRSVIVRTAWLFSPHRDNFLTRILRLAADRPTLQLVSDQRGSPTSATDLAEAIMSLATRLTEDEQAPTGIYHFVNAGNATRHELALEILRQSEALGGPSALVEPVSTARFSTAARRPSDSRLSTEKIGRDFGILPRPWREAVADVIAMLDERGELQKVKR